MDAEKTENGLFDRLYLPYLFKSFLISLQPGKLFIALLAVAAIFLTGWIMDKNETVVIESYSNDVVITELDTYLKTPDKMDSFIEANKNNNERQGVFETIFKFGSLKFHHALESLFRFDIPTVMSNISEYFKAIGWIFRYHTIYFILFGLIKLSIISVAGGAICRNAALHFSKGEKLGIIQVTRYSSKRFKSFFTAPLLPLVMIFFAAIVFAVFSLLFLLPYLGELVTSIFSFILFLLGFIVAIVIVGSIAGINLVYPAIAYDGVDSFDAISRAFSYFYSKHWRTVLYMIVAAVYGAVCYFFVRFFAFLWLWVTSFLVKITTAPLVSLINAMKETKLEEKFDAIWPEPTFMDLMGHSAEPAGTTQSIAAFFVNINSAIIVGLVIAFILSFYFSSNTIIYALLRKLVDKTELDEVYREQDDNLQPLPEMQEHNDR